MFGKGLSGITEDFECLAKDCRGIMEDFVYGMKEALQEGFKILQGMQKESENGKDIKGFLRGWCYV